MANSLPTRVTSKITFYQGTPFDDTYKHVVRFEESAQIDNYLSEFPSFTFESSYQNLNRPIRVPTGDNKVTFKLDGKYAGGNMNDEVTYNDLLSYNYIRIEEHIHHQNGYENTMNDNDLKQNATRRRIFYAFPTAYEYQNDGTTLVNFSIDTWNTYSWQMKFTNGYVTRAHVDPYIYDNQKIHYGVDDYNKLDLYKPKGWSAKFLNVKNNVDEVGGDGAPVLIQNGSYRFIDTAHDGNPDGRPWYSDDYVQWLVLTVQPQDATKEDGSTVGVYSQYKMLVAPLDLHNNKLLDVYMVVDGENNQTEYKKVFDGKGVSLVDYYKAIASDSTLLGTDSLVVDAEILPYFGLPFSLEVDKDSSEIKGVFIQTPEGNPITTSTLKLKKTKTDTGDSDKDSDSDSDSNGDSNNDSNSDSDSDKTDNETEDTDIDGFLWFNDVNMNDFVGQLGVATPNTHNREEGLRANVNKSQPLVLTILRLLYTYMQRNNAPQSYINPKLIGGAFTNFQFTDGRGNVRNLNPLQIVDNTEWETDQDYWLPLVFRFGGLAPNSKLEYTFPQFNRARNMATFDSVGDAGDYYDRPINAENSAVIDQSAHDVPIVLDTYAMFINANRNQLAVTRSNAQIALQLAKEGNALQVTNAGIMANAGVASAQVNGSATAAQANNNAYASQATAYNSSRLQSGNAAATTLRNGRIMAGAQADNGAIAAGAMVQSAQIQAAANMQVARNNEAFQNKVATNNYEEVLRNQNAMLADTKNHNDVIAHQGSNLTWDIQNKNFPSWAIYTASPSVLNMANTYFNLFGISVGLYEDVNKYFNQFTHFNYMKVQDIGIVSDSTSEYRLPPTIAVDIIKSVFANGVTIWQPIDYAYDGSSWQDKFLNRDILNNVPVKAIDN